MTDKEAMKLLALIKVAYPSAYKDLDKDMTIATVKMWQSTFPDTPYVIMEMAFENYRRSKKFPPTVADIFEELENLYWGASFEANIAKQRNDELAIKKCLFIMNNTDHHRRESINHIQIDRISNEMLIGTEKKYLIEDN